LDAPNVSTSVPFVRPRQLERMSVAPDGSAHRCAGSTDSGQKDGDVHELGHAPVLHPVKRGAARGEREKRDTRKPSQCDVSVGVCPGSCEAGVGMGQWGQGGPSRSVVEGPRAGRPVRVTSE
jgi:hypothetical protein